jgi:hypothetical protein
MDGISAGATGITIIETVGGELRDRQSAQAVGRISAA